MVEHRKRAEAEARETARLRKAGKLVILAGDAANTERRP
jgi:predicted ATP-dependent protease